MLGPERPEAVLPDRGYRPPFLIVNKTSLSLSPPLGPWDSSTTRLDKTKKGLISPRREREKERERERRPAVLYAAPPAGLDEEAPRVTRDERDELFAKVLEEAEEERTVLLPAAVRRVQKFWNVSALIHIPYKFCILSTLFRMCASCRAARAWAHRVAWLGSC